MLLELLLAAQTISQSLLAGADSRNQAFVGCLFSISREAHAGGLNTEQFERNLRCACQSEERELRAVSLKILQLRGHSAAEAADRTGKLLSEARRSVVTAYRQPE